MKKLLLLCLVLLGGVMQISATDYYVSGDKRILPYSDADWGIREQNKMHATSVANVYALVVTKSVASGTDYLFKFVEKDGNTEHWYGYDGGDGNTTLNFTYGTTYTIIFYYNASTHKGRFIVTPMLRWDLGDSGNGNWTWCYEDASMLTRDGDFSWTMEITPAKFTKDTSFRIYSAAWDKSAYPNGQDIAVTYGGASVNSAYFNYTASTDWSWKISKPSYTFEKVVITATYKPFNDDDFGQWEVSADAYITKEVSKDNQYATLGCSVPLEIVEANGVTAHPLTANASTGIITKGDAISVIPSNEGALLENLTGNDKTIRAKVLADDPSVKPSNQLVAFTGTGKLTQPTTGEKTYYILTKKNDNVGFYKVNTTSGNSMGANTAYLEVDGAITLARDFFVLEGETTGIANLNVNDNANFNADAPMYNLAGQRVGKNYKGVVIVNGKKMILK